MRARVRRWLVLLGPILVVTTAGAIVHGESETAAAIAVSLVVGALIAPSPRYAVLACGATLAASSLILPAERASLANLWQETGATTSLRDHLRRTSIVGESAAARHGSPSFAYLWAEGSDRAVLRTEVTLVEGTPGWGWYTFDPGFRLTLERDGDVTFVRVASPGVDAEQRYIARHFVSAQPLAGRTFRARAMLRSPYAFAGVGCQGLRLQDLDDGRGTCSDLVLTPEWRTHELVWRAHEGSDGHRLRVSLHQVDVPHYDLGPVTLEEWNDGDWHPVGPLEPVGVTVFAVTAGDSRPASERITVMPGAEGSRLALELVVDEDDTERLVIIAQAEPGISVALGAAEVEAHATWQLRPDGRTAAWFGGPNLAAHAFVALTAVGSTLAPPVAAVALTVVAVVNVLGTGSRAAWWALLVVAASLVSRLTASWATPWRRTAVIGIVGAIVVAVLVALPNQRVWQLADGNDVPRTEIWRFGLATWVAHPVTGVGLDGFAEQWRQAHPEDPRRPPSHAHNLWIQYAAGYGVLGFAGAAWLTLGLATVAWRRGRWLGLGMLAPILLLQAVDTTLFYAWVLYPTILGLNALETAPDDVDVAQPTDARSTRAEAVSGAPRPGRGALE
jgi:hypothetical protein